ncbi:MAG: hypothetical protein IJ060_13405 [Oscillospiraceae bacterium]|nr:hypothetical protein [Oscillospiraceae bacterium]MBQ8923128.1 hypothetical protein [Oscillospiraceae bacterium]
MKITIHTCFPLSDADKTEILRTFRDANTLPTVPSGQPLKKVFIQTLHALSDSEKAELLRLFRFRYQTPAIRQKPPAEAPVIPKVTQSPPVLPVVRREAPQPVVIEKEQKPPANHKHLLPAVGSAAVLLVCFLILAAFMKKHQTDNEMREASSAVRQSAAESSESVVSAAESSAVNLQTYEDIYGEYIYDYTNDNQRLYGDEDYVSPPTGYTIEKYFLEDINQDGVKELILEVKIGGSDESFRECFTYEDGSVQWVGSYDDIYVLEDCFLSADKKGLVIVSWPPNMIYEFLY